MNLGHQSARRYRTPAALRAALDARLTAAAAARAVDVGRLRRQVAFERLLVRLVTPTADTAGSWVLKGGQALELRLDGKFRLTRDLDLATANAVVDGAEAHRHLVAATAQDPEADGFSFSIGSPRPLADLPVFPVAWERDYAELAAGLDLAAATLAAGRGLIQAVWRECVAADG